MASNPARAVSPSSPRRETTLLPSTQETARKSHLCLNAPETRRSGHATAMARTLVQLTSFGGPGGYDSAMVAGQLTRSPSIQTAAGEYDIWVIGADGGRPQRMTSAPGERWQPELVTGRTLDLL